MTQSPGARKAVVAAPKDIYEKIVRSIHDYAIFVLDPAGYITTWTPAAERIKEDMEALGATRLSDVEGAQREIIEAAVRLDSEGQISLEKQENG